MKINKYDKKWRLKKKKGMPTRNEKWQQAIIGVSKRHVGNAKVVKLKMKIFFYQAIESIKILKIESIRYNVGGQQEIHNGHYGH